jgi:hypothetical protein
VNAAGQTAKVGGTLASMLALVALGIGSLLALVFGSIFQWLFQTGLLVAVPILVLTLLVAVPLFFGGRRLNKAGDDRVRAAQEQAVFGVAARQRGAVTVGDVARSLGVREEDADRLLTALAKRPDGRVTLELDEGGGITYLFHDFVPRARVRVSEQAWQAPARIADAAPSPKIIDAELLDDDAVTNGARGTSTARPVTR